MPDRVRHDGILIQVLLFRQRLYNWLVNYLKIIKIIVKDYTGFIIYSGLLVAAISYSINNLNYDWQWYRIPDYIVSFKGGIKAGPLLKGLYVTIKISAISLIIAFVLGLVSALLSISDSFIGKFLSYCYIQLIRNTPLIV